MSILFLENRFGIEKGDKNAFQIALFILFIYYLLLYIYGISFAALFTEIGCRQRQIRAPPFVKVVYIRHQDWRTKKKKVNMHPCFTNKFWWCWFHIWRSPKCAISFSKKLRIKSVNT